MSKLNPTEKANEIFQKMYMGDDIMGNYPMCFDTAMKCSSIAIEEILNLNSVDKDYELSNYWEEVKEQLLKIKL